MAKQINFRSVRLINLKFLFQRLNFFSWVRQLVKCMGCRMHSRLWSQNVRKWRKKFDNLIIKEPEWGISIVTFACDSIFDSCCQPAGYDITWKLSFWVKPSNALRTRLRRTGGVTNTAASRNLLKSIISLTSRENMTFQHYWDPSDARTLPP